MVVDTIGVLVVDYPNTTIDATCLFSAPVAMGDKLEQMCLPCGVCGRGDPLIVIPPGKIFPPKVGVENVIALKCERIANVRVEWVAHEETVCAMLSVGIMPARRLLGISKGFKIPDKSPVVPVLHSVPKDRKGEAGKRTSRCISAAERRSRLWADEGGAVYVNGKPAHGDAKEVKVENSAEPQS